MSADAPAPKAAGAAPAPSPRRDAILAAATELFLQQGYAATSLDAIVAAAGASKATVYAHFGGKEGLFVAVVDAIVGEVVAPLPRSAEAPLGVRAALLHVATTHLTTVLSDRHVALIRLVAGEAGRFPAIGKLYYEHGPRRGHEKLERLLRAQSETGCLTMADPVEAASFFYGMLLHKATLGRLYGVSPAPTPDEVDATAIQVVDAFLAHYAAPG